MCRARRFSLNAGKTEIRAFREHDRAHRTEYLPTLRAYLENNRSTTAAAAALFIHKTTLFYRLEQMEKLAGPFLKDPELLFLYEYSLLLLRLLPGKGDASGGR